MKIRYTLPSKDSEGYAANKLDTYFFVATDEKQEKHRIGQRSQKIDIILWLESQIIVTLARLWKVLFTAGMQLLEETHRKRRNCD